MGEKLQAFIEILKNPYALFILAIALIIFAIFGLPLLSKIPHLIVSLAFIIVGITVLTSPTILTNRAMYKAIVGLMFFGLAVLVLFEPTWFGITVPNMIMEVISNVS